MTNLKIIEDFKKDYKKIIEDFSIIDENDPITFSKLEYLKNALNSWTSTLNETFSKLNKEANEYNKKSNSFYNKYQQKIKVLNDSYNKNIKNINKDYVEAIEKLKSKLEITKKDTSYKIEQYEVEYNYFIATSEQNKNILENDYNEAEKRFDYQKDELRESYLLIVEKRNEASEIIKNKLKDKYTLDKESIINSYNDNIKKIENLINIQEQELKNITTALENEKSGMKEKYRQESANLNENIKKIADEKNKIIDKARNEYNKSINDANIEKENKKTNYQQKSQALLKEFVTKINEIDETANLTKKEYEKKIIELKRQYYTNIYNQTINFHNQLEQIYKASPSFDKITNQLIKYKNKMHLINVNTLKKNQELIILDLTKENTIKSLRDKNNKNFLEIDKNYSIKKINNQEQFDNKYYQENENFYANEFNYNVKNANYKFSQQANLLRCQSQIRTKLLERNFDGISANYYKKIETIQNKINTYKIELDANKKINDLVLTYLEDNYKSHLYLEETSNLLEIEKNKLLKEFNQIQYKFNINSIKLLKDYGYKKIDIENQRAFEEKKIKIILENLILEKNITSTSYAIKKEELNENFSKIKTQIINNHDLEISKENYFNNLLNNDIDYFETIITSNNQFLDSFKRNFINVCHIILNDIYPTEENYRYLESFLNKLLEIFIHFLRKMQIDLSSNLDIIITEKMNYVFDFKYKKSLESTKENYENAISEIKNKENEFLDKIDSSNKTIDNFRQKIYTLINDREMLLLNKNKKKLDSSVIQTIKQTELKIRDYKEKIDNYSKIIKLCNDDIQNLRIDYIKKNKEYKSETLKINKMYNADISLYKDLKNKLKDLFNMFDKELINFNNNQIFAKVAKQLIIKVNKLNNNLNKKINNFKNNLTTIFDLFVKASNKDINKRQALCSLDFNNYVKIFNIKYNKEMGEYKNEYHNIMLFHEKKIDDENRLLSEKLNLYKNRLNLCYSDYKMQNNYLESRLDIDRNKFYASYYALNSNHERNVIYHQQLNIDKDNKYKKDRDDINKIKNHNLNDLNLKLKLFIKTKNEEIEHLPIAYKFNTKILNKETKKKNITLHEDIKLAKVEYNNQNNHIEKNIKLLKIGLNQDNYNNDLEQKRNIINERKNYISYLKQSLKKIKINL